MEIVRVMQTDTNEPQSPFTVQVVSVAVILSPVIQFAVLAVLRLGEIMPEEGFAPVGLSDGLMGGAAVVWALMAAGVSFAVRPRLESVLMRQAGPGLGARMRTILFAMAICESGAVLGFVVGLIGGGLLWPGMAMGISVLGCARHFPSRQWLEAPVPSEGDRDAGT